MKTRNEELVQNLNLLLSNYQMYYQNLRSLHWLVKGKNFFPLHAKYEELYNAAANDVDEIAERILMLEGIPFHSFSEYLESSNLEAAKNISDGEQGMELVLDNNRSLLQQFKSILEYSNELDDEGTSAMMSDFISKTEKLIWMLRSSLQ